MKLTRKELEDAMRNLVDAHGAMVGAKEYYNKLFFKVMDAIKLDYPEDPNKKS